MASNARQLDRSMTGAARALRGLQVLEDSMVSPNWSEVEKRFERLAVDDILLRTRFGVCMGMYITSF
jgi:respiratory burst oxidase